MREAATRVLEENLKAREAADFATQCATLAAAAQEIVASPKKGAAAARACPAALAKLADPLSHSKPFRIDTLGGPVAALRVKGKQAEALYHGNDGKDYAMPMAQEEGHWKAAAILTTELNPPAAKKSSATPKPGK